MRRVRFLHGVPSMLHLTGALLLLAMAGAFFLGIHQPLHARQETHRSLIGRLQRKISNARQAKQQRETIQAAIRDLEQRAADVQKRIPRTAKEAELLGQLATIADDTRFTVSDYRRGQVRREGVYTRFDIGLTGEASFASIGDFIDKLYKLPRVNKVHQLQIHNSNESDVYPVNLTIAFYYGGE